jgi:hypothetical protein
MVLASTIKDKSGNILLLRGTQITEKHIEILKKRALGKVSVEGSPVPRKGPAAEDLRGEIDRMFSTAGSHPVVIKIKETIKELLS